MADYGIKVSKDAEDANTTDITKLLMSSEYPYTKIDTSRESSLTTVNFTFRTDPPEPAGATPVKTLVYSHIHGYDYIPQYWVAANVIAPGPLAVAYQSWFSDSTGGIISKRTSDDEAVMFFRADATAINVYISKYYIAGLGAVNNLVGANVKISFYVFVDNI